MIALIILILMFIIGLIKLIFGNLEGLFLISFSLFLMLIGSIVDKILNNDWFLGIKELINAFKGKPRM
jgi:hypothetical protein